MLGKRRPGQKPEVGEAPGQYEQSPLPQDVQGDEPRELGAPRVEIREEVRSQKNGESRAQGLGLFGAPIEPFRGCMWEGAAASQAGIERNQTARSWMNPRVRGKPAVIDQVHSATRTARTSATISPPSRRPLCSGRLQPATYPSPFGHKRLGRSYRHVMRFGVPASTAVPRRIFGPNATTWSSTAYATATFHSTPNAPSVSAVR